MNAPATQIKIDWEILAQLPEAPDLPVLPVLTSVNEIPTIHALLLRAGLDGVWKGSGKPVALLHSLRDVASIRAGLGLTQKQMGRLIAAQMNRREHYTENAVSSWEWWHAHLGQYRGAHRVAATKKYAPPENVIAAYVGLVIAVAQADGVMVQARASRDRARWSFTGSRACRTCGRAFVPGQDRIVNCKRCRSRK